MTWIEQLNEISYFYLTNLHEPGDNQLSFTLEEAPAADFDDEFESQSPAEQHDFPATQEARAFEVRFTNYIAYAVRNESFAINDNYEVYLGALARVYERSRFLDFVASSTLASNTHPGPFKHYGFLCLEHVIDVVAPAPPVIVAA